MTGSRRSFLKLWAAAPALGLSPPPRAVERSSFDPWVEVRPDHLRHNVAQIHRRVGGRKVLAVIKNNGYGLGVAAAAQAIEGEPAIAGFAVVKLHEAATLRDAGVRKPVLCMGPLGESDLGDAVALDIQPMVYTPVGAALERIAARRGRPVPIHVCVDTGIGRVGVPYREAAVLLRDLASRRGLTIAGTMMTFTEDPEFDREQLRRFQTLCDGLKAEGLSLGQLHAASSFALFQNEEAFLDMVRPGMAIYGVYSEPPFRGLGLMDLRPAVALRARVAYVKQLRAGDSAGGHAPRGSRGRPAPPGGQGRPSQDWWPALPHRGHRLREPLHRGAGPGAAGAHRRRGHPLRLGRRLTPGGPGRRLRRVRLRPAHASGPAAAAPHPIESARDEH